VFLWAATLFGYYWCGNPGCLQPQCRFVRAAAPEPWPMPPPDVPSGPFIRTMTTSCQCNKCVIWSQPGANMAERQNTPNTKDWSTVPGKEPTPKRKCLIGCSSKSFPHLFVV